MIAVKDLRTFVLRNKLEKQRQSAEMICKKKMFLNFTGKHLCWSLFLIKRLQHNCFPVKFAKFFRKTIVKNMCERLLLKHLLLQSQNTKH